jgi:glutaryl-CoA dehydrogenase
MATFKGVDYLQVESLFNEEELLVRQTARQFVEDRIIPVIKDCYNAGRFPMDVVPLMGELGFFGANLEGYGCAELSNVEYGLIMQELERGDSGLRSFVSVQGALVMYPIRTFGSEEQRKKWLPELAAGRKIGCFGLTEPGFGSNPAGMTTRAKRDGAAWVLNGEKTWITNGTLADVAVVWARTDEGIRGFLVEKGTPGFTSSDIHGKLSMRASVTSSLSLTDCRVSEENRLPDAKGLKSALACLTQARFGIGWGVVGAAMDCYETARQYSIERKQFDNRPIASHQLVQEKLARMITEITKAQLLAIHCGRLKDQGKLEPAHVSMLKGNNVSMALECARLSRDLLGANGIIDDYPIMRHMCNLETVRTYEGTDHIHTLVVGERVTGVAAYK